jgi:UDP-4-amino-4,6-dideoxy-N-acetyl-beta-L-altrosamine transaminase
VSDAAPPFLPYGRQDIDDADVAAVARALRGDLITQGPTVGAFEDAFAAYVGARHAVAFSSGTAALHGAAFAVGVAPGDVAVTSPITFVASMNSALYLGAAPRFADVDPDTWNLDVRDGAAFAGAKLIVPVSFAGLPVDVAALRAVAPEGAAIVEDAAHALGAIRDGARVGGPGAGGSGRSADVTCFSLHPVKTMTTGEGGVATTEDDALAERLRAFRTHGIVRGDATTPGAHDGGWWYEMRELGFNYRITDVQCALGLSQLPRVEGWVRRRNALALAYRERLAGEERIALPPAAPEGSRHGHHLFVIGVRAGAAERRRVFDGLRAAGIGVQVHYIPVTRQPYYRQTFGIDPTDYPHAEAYYERAITLPLFPAMDEGDVDRVVGELTRLLDAG